MTVLVITHNAEIGVINSAGLKFVVYPEGKICIVWHDYILLNCFENRAAQILSTPLYIIASCNKAEKSTKALGKEKDERPLVAFLISFFSVLRSFSCFYFFVPLKYVILF